MDTQAWTFIFVGATFALYLGIAWLSRVKDTQGFYVAGRGVPAIANGMATGADWMSAASFISMAGLISTMGYAGGVYLMGWTGGYVLLALLLAPYLRKFGHFTVPDFVGDRYPTRRSADIGDASGWDAAISRTLANPARLVAVVCAIFVSFTYVAGQMKGVGVVFSRFLEVELATGVIIGMVIVFVYATLGGMKGITWTQVAQYWVLITAFLIPAIAISIKLTGIPIPQIGMGSAVTEAIDPAQPYLLDKLNTINQDLGFSSYTETFTGSWDKINVFCVALALMAGTAGLPHVIVRFYTVKNVKAARWSAFWALFFISLLYLTAPATASFARYYFIDSIQDKTAEELPDWFNNWEKTGLIYWLDDGDGRLRYSNTEDNEVFNQGTLSVPDDDYTWVGGDHTSITWGNLIKHHNQWIGSDGAKGADARQILKETQGGGFAKLSGPDRDIIVLATPEMADLYDWIIALVVAGGLAAALSTASGLLLVISSSIAHDLYARVINPQATEAKRLLVGRTVIGFAVVVAGLFGIYPPGFVGQVVAFAFGLAAASFFPAIVLGIFTTRVGTIPAVCGMLTGIIFTGVYICVNVFPRIQGWVGLDGPVLLFGINPQGIGTVGMLLNFAVTLALTPFCAPASDAVKAMVEGIREPEGEGPAVDIDSAAEH